LKWLVNNHEDYRNDVTIDEESISSWESTFISVELLDSIGHVSNPSAKDASQLQDRFGMDNPDDDETTDDLPFMSSGIVDFNKGPDQNSWNNVGFRSDRPYFEDE